MAQGAWRDDEDIVLGDFIAAFKGSLGAGGAQQGKLAAQAIRAERDAKPRASVGCIYRWIGWPSWALTRRRFLLTHNQRQRFKR